MAGTARGAGVGGSVAFGKKKAKKGDAEGTTTNTKVTSPGVIETNMSKSVEKDGYTSNQQVQKTVLSNKDTMASAQNPNGILAKAERGEGTPGMVVAYSETGRPVIGYGGQDQTSIRSKGGQSVLMPGQSYEDGNFGTGSELAQASQQNYAAWQAQQTAQPNINVNVGQPQAQPQNAETGNKGFVQSAAELGVTPAVKTANLIARGIELLTGKEEGSFGRITAEEFASTPYGKALGLGTDAAALALAGVAGSQLAAGAGIGGGAGAGTAATTTAAATGEAAGAGVAETGVALAGRTAIPLSVKGIIGALVSKNAAVAAFVSKHITGIALGAGAFMASQQVSGNAINNAEGVLSTSENTASLINEAVAAGAMSADEALSYYDSLNEDITKSESAIKAWSYLSMKDWGTQKELLTKSRKTETNMAVKKQLLMNAIVSQMRTSQ